MEKTTEQKIDAALAECERLVPTSKQVEIKPMLTIQRGYVQDILGDDCHFECFYMNRGGRSIAQLWAKSNDTDIEIFYSVLGIEARDAVKGLTDELEETNANYRHDVKSLDGKWKASEARAVKLVEALESIMHHHGYTYTATDRPITPVGKLAQSALEAYKKGGAGE